VRWLSQADLSKLLGDFLFAQALIKPSDCYGA